MALRYRSRHVWNSGRRQSYSTPQLVERMLYLVRREAIIGKSNLFLQNFTLRHGDQPILTHTQYTERGRGPHVLSVRASAAI